MRDQEALVTEALPPAARAAIYRLASRLVRAEVDAALLDALRAPAVLEVLERAAPGVGADLADWTPARQEAADVAFTSLFLLPGGVPPRAEAWIDPSLARPLRDRVATALTRLNREVDATLPPDHAALLFDLAAHLLDATPPDDDGATALLAPWLDRFARALEAFEAPPLYRALGRLLSGPS